VTQNKDYICRIFLFAYKSLEKERFSHFCVHKSL